MAEPNPANVAALFLEHSRAKLIDQYWPRLRECVELLTDEQVWWRPNEASNSVGNIVLHLNGNVRQWLVASFNHLEDDRNRPAEFNQREVVPKSVLLERLAATMQQASNVLARLTEADLLMPMNIQGYEVTGLKAVYQVVEHFGLHYGQVLYVTKMLRDKDLGYYKELSKTGRTTSGRGY